MNCHQSTKVITVSALIFLSYALAFGNVISGKIEYDKYQYNLNGFTGTITQMPVRFATVQVVVGNDLYTTTTLVDGTFSVTTNNNGFLNVNVGVSVYTTINTSLFKTTVLNFNNNAVYAVAIYNGTGINTNVAQNLNTNMGNTFFDITAPNPPASSSSEVAGAFNIFNAVYWNWEYVRSLGSAVTKAITIYWADGVSTSTLSSNYDSTKKTISIQGDPTDEDQWDDDIIIHECGHFIADNYSVDHSPGGSHTITGQFDPRLTWSEGWGSFWSARVRNFAGIALYPNPSFIVDNKFNNTPFVWDMDAPSSSSLTIHSTNEVAICYVLWHILTNSSSPTISKPDSFVWLTITSGDFINQGASLGLKLQPEVTLEDFWLVFIKDIDTSSADITTLQQNILANRQIRFIADAQEPNDTSATSKPLSGTITGLTFYRIGTDPTGDVDYFSFAVSAGQTATIQTQNLADGSDTFITLFDTNGTTVLSWDDDSGGVTSFTGSGKTSKITYSFITSGTYFVKVEPYSKFTPNFTSSSPWLTIFGSYDINISIGGGSSGGGGSSSSAISSGGGSSSGGGGACGLTGLDTTLFLSFVYFINRRFKRRHYL